MGHKFSLHHFEIDIPLLILRELKELNLVYMWFQQDDATQQTINMLQDEFSKNDTVNWPLK